MAAWPKWIETKALLACWNADGVRSRKQEMDHFLGLHGIDICLLTETHLRSGVVFWMANVCHRTNRLTEGGGTVTLVRHGRDHHAVPIQGLEYLAVYLSPSLPLLDTDLSTCLGGGLPVLMAGDLNAKHVEWRGSLF
jgi:hypothetical protein